MENVETLRKVTVRIPEYLLRDAQEFTGTGVTQTVTAGLEKLAAGRAYDRLLAMKGKYKKIDLDLKASRADRNL